MVGISVGSRRLRQDVRHRRVGEEVELDEEQAGDQALRLQLGAQPAVDQLARSVSGSVISSGLPSSDDLRRVDLDVDRDA